jgi:predicted AAA+ superfamily ATPase
MAKVVTSKMLMALQQEPTTKSLEVERVNKILTETDDEILDRLRDRFEILDDMTRAVKAGKVKAMIVTGPPGVGKSYGVERVLSKHDVFATVANDSKLKKYEVVKGAMSAIGLYSKLYHYSDKKNVLVFDDCDSILLDDLSLNILKAALDSSKKRMIHWNTDSSLLRREGVPDSFEFKGGAIFITNIKFDHVKSKKLRDHLEALESRCHYLDLTIDTEREKVLRIKQVVTECGMLDDYELTDEDKLAVVEFVAANTDRVRELSLRTVLKIADLCASFPDKWKSVAEMTCMRNSR